MSQTFNFKKVLKFLLNEMAYGGHIQSLGAVGIVFVSAVLLKVKAGWDILIIVYLMFYSFYLYNRFKEIHIDYLTNPQRTEHLKIYIKFAPLIFYIVVAVLFVSLIYFSNFQSLIFSLLLFIFGILYTAIFKKITRRLAFFKDIYVSLFFALMPFYLFVYYSYALTYYLTSIIILSLFIFLKMFLIQIFLDVKDFESDKKEGLLTLPTIFGREQALKIFFSADVFITAVFPVFFSWYVDIFPRLVFALLLTIPWSFYCYILAKQRKYSAYILQSGEFILWPIFIIISQIIILW
jgi:4-hydroxybenzoate polyprenyltransferase